MCVCMYSTMALGRLGVDIFALRGLQIITTFNSPLVSVAKLNLPNVFVCICLYCLEMEGNAS